MDVSTASRRSPPSPPRSSRGGDAARKSSSAAGQHPTQPRQAQWHSGSKKLVEERTHDAPHHGHDARCGTADGTVPLLDHSLIRALGALLSVDPSSSLRPHLHQSGLEERAVLRVAEQDAGDTPEHDGLKTTKHSTCEGRKHFDGEIDVRWLASALPPYLLTLLTAPNLDCDAMMEGMEILHALARLVDEVPSIGQGLASVSDVFVELLWCLLDSHVSDYCQEIGIGSSKHIKTSSIGETVKNCTDVYTPIILQRTTTILCCFLKTELLRPHHPALDGSDEHPLLEAFLRQEDLDEIIQAFIDSLRILLHHCHQDRSLTKIIEEILCKLVESLYLLCFADDFAKRFISHRLFTEGHLLQVLEHILKEPNANEGALSSSLGMLAILCEKQQPEFLALAHQQSSTHGILHQLLTLAASYLDALSIQPSTSEERKAKYRETTYGRLFHCLVMFADHPQYKTALVQPGTKLLWKFLTLPSGVFVSVLDDAKSRGVVLHLLHFLISLALPCPTASWEDITGGRTVQLGSSELVAVVCNIIRTGTTQLDPEAAELAVRNLERTVSALYAADNIHFPIEHLLTLQSLATTLRSSILPSSSPGVIQFNSGASTSARPSTTTLSLTSATETGVAESETCVARTAVATSAEDDRREKRSVDALKSYDGEKDQQQPKDVDGNEETEESSNWLNGPLPKKPRHNDEKNSRADSNLAGAG